VDFRDRDENFPQFPPNIALTDADFLVGVSDVTRQGALRFRADPDGDFLAEGGNVPKLIDLPRLLRAADTVSRDDDLAAIKDLLDAGTGSLGGDSIGGTARAFPISAR
jgi:serine/threonine-protein kinase HipA